MEVITKLKILDKVKKEEKSFCVLILNIEPTKNSYNGKILGLSLCEWVKFASGELNTKIIDFKVKDGILNVVKDNINLDFDYTIILLSTTPLITNNTIKNIQEYAVFKNITLCKLPVGYVINNKEFSKNSNTNIDSVYSLNTEEFYIVESKVQYNYAFKILNERINNFHIENGVEIINPSNTHIEPFVDIDSGVCIYPNNVLKGNCCISSDVILKENNVLDNVIIGNGSCVSNSVIVNSKIENNVYISSFCEIMNSTIQSNVLIEKSVGIKDSKIKANKKILANTNIIKNRKQKEK